MFKLSVLMLALVACGEDEDVALQYYTSCGDPVCAGYEGPTEGLSVCDSESEGATCTEDGAECDLENTCNQRLICASEDPATACPVSRSKHKRDIAYINEQKAGEIADAVRQMKIAEWNYHKDATARKARLGFLIDDQPLSPAVLENGEQVDVYGYTSMAIVAIQQQAAHIERLEKKIAELEAKIAEK
ncbi:MAG: hypothetical protein VX278_05215 [Myxococcota bacterium]|nr:hypothetical protein [Myxococcota bacterium]